MIGISASGNGHKQLPFPHFVCVIYVRSIETACSVLNIPSGTESITHHVDIGGLFTTNVTAPSPPGWRRQGTATYRREWLAP